MWTRCVLASAFILAFAGTAAAQHKLVATQECPKPDPDYAVPVGDRPDHVIALAKVKCT